MSVFVLVIWPAVSVRDDQAMSFSYRVGTFLGAGLIGILFGAIGWFAGRRSVLAANVGFAAIIGLTGTGTVLRDLQLERAARNQMAFQRIEQWRQSMAAQDTARLESGKLNVDDGELNRRIDAIRSASGEAGGDVARIGAAVADLLGELVPANKAFTDAVKAFTDDGGVRVETLLSIKAIDHRIELVNIMQTANESVRSRIKAMPKRYREILVAKDLSTSQVNAAMIGFQDGTVQILLQIRDCEQRAGENMLARLRLLKDHWARWHRDMESGKIIFMDGELVKQYNDYGNDSQKIVEEEAALQRKLIDLASTKPR